MLLVFVRTELSSPIAAQCAHWLLHIAQLIIYQWIVFNLVSESAFHVFVFVFIYVIDNCLVLLDNKTWSIIQIDGYLHVVIECGLDFQLITCIDIEKKLVSMRTKAKII